MLQLFRSKFNLMQINFDFLNFKLNFLLFYQIKPSHIHFGHLFFDFMKNIKEKLSAYP